MEKWFLQSKTIWGGIILFVTSMLPVIQNFLGIDVSADEVRELGDAGGRLIENAGAFIGLALVFLGRWRAKKDLTLAP